MFDAENNSIMSTIIFLSIAIFVASIMLIIKIELYIDLKDLCAVVIIRVYSIKIIEIKVDIITLKYRINNSAKEKRIKLIINKEQEYLILQIKKSILDKLYYDNLTLKTQIGLSDAALTANIAGIIETFCKIFKLFLNYNRKDIDFNYQNNVDFINQNTKFEFNAKVYFTIFDMIFALIMSFYKRGKYVKEK